MPQYIKVIEEENEEPMEIPCEEDDTVLLTTLTSLFPGASGLKYRSSESGAFRGLRLIDGKIQPPEEGWTEIGTFFCCFPKENKRKIEDSADTSNTKTQRIEEKKKATDLIVLGLAWKTTDKELKEYFEQYGELLMAQVKKDPKTGDSKGFGFIRFKDYENQSKVLSKRHCIDGRSCDVRIPMSKDSFGERNPEVCKKIFIGRLSESIQKDDLNDYFSKYGEIEDIFIPKPFRGFAFVTFQEPGTAQKLCGDDHLIKGNSVYVSTAVPKYEMNSQLQQQYGYNGNKSYGRYGGPAGGPYHNSYVSTHHGYSSPPPPPPSHLNHSGGGGGSLHHENHPGHPPSSYSSHYDYYSTRNRNYHDNSASSNSSPYSNRYSQQQAYNASDYHSYY